MLNTSKNPNTIRVIKQGDSNWMFQCDMLLVPRAAVCITKKCPESIAWQIRHAIHEGWVTLEAHVPETEYAWEQLQK